MSEWDDLNEGGAAVDDMIDRMMDADDAGVALRAKRDISVAAIEVGEGS